MVALLDTSRERVRPIRHDRTGKVIGFNTDHWSGRTDALVRPVARPMGLLRDLAAELGDPHRPLRQAVSGGAISASGMFVQTMLDTLDATQLAIDSSSDQFDGRLVTDSYTPNFSTHTAWSSASGNEVSGTGYSAGGVALTSFAAAVNSGALTLDATDTVYSTTTLSSVMAEIWVDDTLTGDPMLVLFDFVTAVDTVAGDLTVQYGSPAVSIDLTP